MATVEVSSRHKWCHAADPTAVVFKQIYPAGHGRSVSPARQLPGCRPGGDRPRSDTRSRPAGPNVRARMGLSGLCLWYGAPPHGATSSIERASANGARASTGSASTCCCDWSSVVTVYNAATGPAGPWSAAAARQPECPPRSAGRTHAGTWPGAPPAQWLRSAAPPAARTPVSPAPRTAIVSMWAIPSRRNRATV